MTISSNVAVKISASSVLLVDDEPEMRAICQTHLESLGKFKSIVHAEDGSEALRKLENQKFDLIILDLGLPKVTGEEVLDFIHTNSENVISSVVLLSGMLDRKIVRKAKKMGVSFFIVKPITAKKFAMVITQFFSGEQV